MNFQNIADNLVAAAIWALLAFLAFQAKRLRDKVRKESQERKLTAERLQKAAAETHSMYDAIFRQDALLLAQMIIASSRRAVSFIQFLILVNVIMFSVAGLDMEMFPGNSLHKWTWVFILVCSIWNVFNLMKVTADIDAYENGVMKGLKERMDSKMEVIKQQVAKSGNENPVTDKK